MTDMNIAARLILKHFGRPTSVCDEGLASIEVMDSEEPGAICNLVIRCAVPVVRAQRIIIDRDNAPDVFDLLLETHNALNREYTRLGGQVYWSDFMDVVEAVYDAIDAYANRPSVLYDLAHLTHEHTAHVEPTDGGICTVFIRAPDAKAETGYVLTDIEAATEFFIAIRRRMEFMTADIKANDGTVTWMTGRLNDLILEINVAVGSYCDEHRDREYRNYLYAVLEDTDAIKTTTGMH